MSAAPTETSHATIRQAPAQWLLGAVSSVAPGLKPAAQRSLIRLGYATVNRWLDRVQAASMNYGYAPLDADAAGGEADGGEVYSHQLYERVAAATTLEDAEALEVGCGRGGGAAFVARRFGVARLTGLDFSDKAIAYARARHSDRRLRFLCGDAEELPFADASFDAVLNVESSHCYPSMARFVAEVFRVLRPGGHLLFADLRLRKDVDDMRQAFLDAGFAITEEEPITPNVVRALELDSPRRVEFVRRQVPRPLRSHALNFAATEGSEVYEAMRTGGLEYLRFALVKPAA